MQQIPAYITPILWDVDVAKLSLEKHSSFIIERILEYGGFDALHWAEGHFGKEVIMDTLKKSKRLSAKTGRFYAVYFGVSSEDFVCIQKPYTQKQNRF